MFLMKYSSLPALLILIACTPQTTDPLADSNVVTEEKRTEINIGHIDTIESAILGEDRDIWIYLPRSAQDEFNTQHFPVVYLLDGSGHFHSVSGMVRQLSTTNGNKVVPEMIVVGIPNTDRFRDLTPTHTEGTSGGGAAFLDFLQSEVIPHVETNYPASQYRTFIGHSLGGLMAIEALITRPEVFSNYVAIDPSLWWDDQSVLLRAEAALEERDFSGKSLFVSIANTMPPGMSLEDVEADSQERTTHIRSILQFSRKAETDTRSGLDFNWAYYDEDHHGSVPLISEYDAFRYLFPWYDPGQEVIELLNPELPDDSSAAVEIVREHFDSVSRRFGYNTMPPRSWINQLASGFQFNEKPEAALGLFQMNLSNYPSHPQSHEALADFYVAQEQQDLARMHFEHAVELGAEIDIEEKLSADLSD